MGKPDITHKMLLSFNDEFANVFSALALKGKVVLDPKRLKEAQTSYQHLDSGVPRELQRDVVKIYDGQAFGLFIAGIENQMRPDYRMPVRVMGYDWTRYNYQLSQLWRKNRKTDFAMNHSASAFHSISPVITHILNFSYKERWNGPTSVRDLVNLPSGLEDYFQDYKIHVTDLAWLSESERALLTGDFRILVDALCEMQSSGRITGSDRPIKRLEVLMAALATTTGRKSFLNMKYYKYNNSQGGVSMCEVMDRWEAKLKKEGIEIGTEKGIEIGTERERNKIVMSMIQHQLDESLIAELTNLSISDIQKLRKAACLAQ